MKFFNLLVAALVMGTVSANAADIGGITVNGEASFDYNFVSSKGTDIPNTDGAKNETYRFNRAQALLKKETDQISFTGRLVYIPTQYSSDGTATTKSFIGTLNQMELFYKVNPTLQIGFGRLLTTMGYESAMKYENQFYTPTLAYNLIVPGYGEGLRVKYVAGDWMTATLSTYNQFSYDAIGEDDSNTKATELSVTGSWDKLSWFAGHLMGTDTATSGSDEKTSSDVWVQYKIADNMMLAVVYDSRTVKNSVTDALNWYDTTSAVFTYGMGMHSIGLRYEALRGADNAGYATKEVNAVSIGDKIALNDNLSLHVEYRMDTAKDEVFVDKDGAPKKDANLITLGAVAHF